MMQHDSLDLEALRQENEHVKKHTRRRWIIAGVLYVLIVVGILSYLLVRADSLSESLAAMLALPPTIILTAVPMWLLTLSVHHYRLHSRAFRHFYTTYPDLPRRPLAALRLKLQGFTASLFIVFLLLGVPAIISWLGYDLSLLHLLVLFLIYAIVPTRLRDWYFSPSNRGDYQLSERRLRLIRSVLPRSRHLKLIHAIVLFQAKDFEQAEQLSRELIERAKQDRNPGLLCVALNNMGYHTVQTGRYEEGLALLEQAIRVFPFLSEPYDSLATYYTVQNFMPERAVPLCELALFLNQNPQSKSIQLATYAYALAQQGQGEAAMQQLYEAEQKVPKHSVPVLAETQRQMGFAHLTLGDPDRARNCFYRAANADPNGIYGDLARQTLENLPVPEGFTKESYFDL